MYFMSFELENKMELIPHCNTVCVYVHVIQSIKGIQVCTHAHSRLTGVQ